MIVWLKKLFSCLGKYTPSKKENIFWIYIQCQKCGEKIKILVNPQTDLVRGYSEDEPAYSLYKEAMDSKCLSKIRLRITYDKNFNEKVKNISGGEFISKPR